MPSFDAFTRVDADGAVEHDAAVDAPLADGPPSDAPADATPHDAGPLDCARGLLACARRCADLMVAPTVVDFDGDTGALNLRVIDGAREVEDGHLLLHAPETWLLSSQSWSFGAAMTCAEVELTFEETDATSAFLLGLRGPEHGVLARLRPAMTRAHLVSFEPGATVLDEAPFALPAGPERYLVQAYVTDDYAHAEAVRLSTSEHVVLHDTYRGAMSTLELELSFYAVRGRARVDWLEVGRPTSGAREIMERGR
ncbi:MAG: hypothetical protein KF901_14400 [Myxococcales bacterium]|nr:hypothetical protein [Myxococcales bacterium]